MNQDQNTKKGCGCKDPRDCSNDSPGSTDRRSFIRTSMIGATAALLPRMPLFAGPFDENDYLKYIPADKKLDPAWLKSLVDRGQKQVYSDPTALSHIGMPVGGLFAGTVYLSGDGQLWLWDIFNRDQEGIQPRPVDLDGKTIRMRDGANFVEPAKVKSPFKQGFFLRIGEHTIPLNQQGFKQVSFDGRYPMASVSFADDKHPIEVSLEAFSPFIPLQANQSDLPLTVMSYTLKNAGQETVAGSIGGFCENPVGLDSSSDFSGQLVNRRFRSKETQGILFSAEALSPETGKTRKDIVFEDFEGSDYGDWIVSGQAFGHAPAQRAAIPDYQGDVGGEGSGVVNSHASAPGNDVQEKDSAKGTLTSPEFVISRKFINFYVGGGAHVGKTSINLLIGGEVVRSTTGANANQMKIQGWDVTELQGKLAQIQIVDEYSGGWGNIGIDQLVFSDEAPKQGELEEQPDFGTFFLGCLAPAQAEVHVVPGSKARKHRSTSLTDRHAGDLEVAFSLKPGEEEQVVFFLTWHFPNFYGQAFNGAKVGHYYASRFTHAAEVAEYFAIHADSLMLTTRDWVKTWYDSTLPWWLLDRTMANTSTLATTTCYRFKDGRFWAWEGIGCCPGTCTHVWHYAQAPGRLFPEVERDQRERVDFGLAFRENGEIGYRAMLNSAMGPAFDGQCGRILGAFREHLMSAKSDFLHRNWPNIRQSIQYMMDIDLDLDGILEGAQPNTLDAAWYGKISFISSLYLSALKAGELMALEMKDEVFARKCQKILETGAKSIEQLFNGEYFIQLEDPEHQDVIGVGKGCYIDQIFGQTWAHWLNMGHLFDKEKQLSALRSLWRYNFVPDVGPFRRHFKAGRWYAMAGDGGLLMCTWPKGGKRDQWEDQWQFMYFNECMSGFEWQAAAHMIYESQADPDLLTYGLAISRAIHDRYDARLRNPYNEIECSDHYARAMASYGVFQAITGFHHHGPKGILQFDPKLHPENFKTAFVTAEGWGTYSQNFDQKEQKISLKLNYGSLRLSELIVRLPTGISFMNRWAEINGSKVLVKIQETVNQTVSFHLGSITLSKGDSLSISLA